MLYIYLYSRSTFLYNSYTIDGIHYTIEEYPGYYAIPTNYTSIGVTVGIGGHEALLTGNQ